MSDLAQEIQQAENKESETSTDTQTSNSDQDILGNSAVQEILGFSEAPSSCKELHETFTCNMLNERPK